MDVLTGLLVFFAITAIWGIFIAFAVMLVIGFSLICGEIFAKLFGKVKKL